MSRIDDFRKLMQTVDSNAFVVVDARDCWPAECRLRMGETWIPVGVHVGGVHPHSRKEYEYRFQNPARADRPAITGAYGHPVLLGVHEYNGIKAVLLDGQSRIGTTTRVSILFNRDTLMRSVDQDSFGIYINTRGDRFVSCSSLMLPWGLDLVLSGGEVARGEARNAVRSAGVLEFGSQESVERARRAMYALVRDRRFSRDVRNAYGDRCAMCGIGSGLVVGAHIYPASAPDSEDVVQNGIALCQNHHAAFDSHWIFVNPDTGAISFNPKVVEQARHDDALQRFISQTYATLSIPAVTSHRPHPDMLRKRYAWFSEGEGEYAWMLSDED